MQTNQYVQDLNTKCMRFPDSVIIIIIIIYVGVLSIQMNALTYTNNNNNKKEELRRYIGEYHVAENVWQMAFA